MAVGHVASNRQGRHPERAGGHGYREKVAEWETTVFSPFYLGMCRVYQFLWGTYSDLEIDDAPLDRPLRISVF